MLVTFNFGAQLILVSHRLQQAVTEMMLYGEKS